MRISPDNPVLGARVWCNAVEFGGHLNGYHVIMADDSLGIVEVIHRDDAATGRYVTHLIHGWVEIVLPHKTAV